MLNDSQWNGRNNMRELIYNSWKKALHPQTKKRAYIHTL